jgi:hypothetical protein
MSQRGLPDDWTLGRPDNEAIDWDYECPVTVPVREVPIKIYLKQKEIEVLPSESWISVSDKLVKAFRLPLGTLFRIYPVIGTVDNQDSEDRSYDITWEEGKQYWFDIVYDDARDQRGVARQIRRVDYGRRTETFVIPNAATTQNVAELWRYIMDVPVGIGMEVRTGNNSEYFWGYRTA